MTGVGESTSVELSSFLQDRTELQCKVQGKET
jgi:hypothetical protein